MIDRVKIIEGLERLLHSGKMYDAHLVIDTCEAAIALLKVNEPRLLTEDDFIDNPRCDSNGCLPVWVEYRTGHCGWTKTSAETMHVGMFALGRQKYRYWTDKPTKEQMKAVKWND